MAPRDRRGGGDGPPMQFLDEIDSESRLLDRLGDASGGVYDEGYGSDIIGGEDDELLEFDEEEAPTASLRVMGPRSNASASASIHLGLPPDEDSLHEVVSLGSGDVLPAAPADDWGDDFDDDDDYDDDYDEFEDDEPPRRPAASPGVRLLSPERDDSLDTDRAWPSLAESDAAPRRDAHSHSSWLDDLPVVRPRLDNDAPPAIGREAAGDDGPSWSAPLLSFESGGNQHGWADETSDEDEVIAAGDEFSLEEAMEEEGLEDTHLPTATFGMPEEDEEPEPEPTRARYFGAPAGRVDDELDNEGDTGNWNRLDILAGPRDEAPIEEQPSFGLPPTPVWRAEDPGERPPPPDAAWEGTDDPIRGPSQEDDGGWPSSPLWSDPTDIVGGREHPSEPVAPPPVMMQSTLKSEIDSRTPLEPKAVVLKTLDGVQRPELDYDEPSDVRSRVPVDQVAPAGRVETETRPVPVEGGGGSGRMLLIIAVTLLITVGAVWQWRNTLFAEPEPFALDAPVVVEPAEPAQLVAEPDPVPPKAVEPPPKAAEPPPKAVEPDPPKVAEPAADTTPEDDLEERRASRRDAIDVGRLYVTSDTVATVYVDGKKVGKAPMERPGIELKPGHYDIRVVPHGRGRTYRTDTRVDAGRVRNIDVKFRK